MIIYLPIILIDIFMNFNNRLIFPIYSIVIVNKNIPNDNDSLYINILRLIGMILFSSRMN